MATKQEVKESEKYYWNNFKPDMKKYGLGWGDWGRAVSRIR